MTAIDLTRVSELIEQRNELNQEIRKLNEQVEELNEEIENECPHTLIRRVDKYHSGGYDHLSSITVSIYCITCGKLVDSYTDPNHHGSFA